MRAPGDWPGKAAFDQFAKFFYVITVLALLSALVLISNTITTLVAEQTSEIAIMKALGGRRRQIAAVYLKTALLLGAIGTILGIALGIALANALTGAFGSTFAVRHRLRRRRAASCSSARWSGLLAPPLAALPAIRRAVRLPAAARPCRRAAPPSAARTPAIALLRRVRFLPRTAQIGLRNVGRRRRRSLSTALAIAFAVGTLLAVLGLAAGISDTSRASWGDHGEDIEDLLRRTAGRSTRARRA